MDIGAEVVLDPSIYTATTEGMMGDNFTFPSTDMTSTEGMIGDNFTLPNINMTTIKAGNMSEMVITLQTITYWVGVKLEPVVFMIGMIFNLLIFIVVINMKMTKNIKTLLLTLTTTDFLASLFGFINIILEAVEFQGTVVYGKWSSEAINVFSTYKIFLLFIGMSSVMVIVTSSIRTYVLRNPLRSRIIITQSFVVKVIIITLSVAFLLFLPCSIYAVWKACFDDRQHPVCAEFFRIIPNAEYGRIWFSVYAIILGPGTVIANIICFALLKAAIYKSSKKLHKMQQQQSRMTNNVNDITSSLHSRKNQRINRMIMYVLVFNTVCIFPSCIQVVSLIINPQTLLFDDTNLSVLIIDLVAETFLGFLPCYNFVIYMIHNKDFRIRFKQLFCRKDLDYVTPNPTPNRHTPNESPRHNTPINGTPIVTPSMTERKIKYHAIRNNFPI